MIVTFRESFAKDLDAVRDKGHLPVLPVNRLGKGNVPLRLLGRFRPSGQLHIIAFALSNSLA